MSVDFNAVAAAVATRFSSTNVTAPAGETNVRLSTSALPGQIIAEPTVLVLPPEPGGIELHYASGTRTGIATFPVHFYLWRIRDQGRNATLCLKWLGALYDQLSGQVHLGLSSYVTHAVISNMGVARLTYAGAEFDGVTLDAAVHFWEALSPIA
jgi:hypothetical protein